MKNTKRSLLLSALALVMCVAMLIGSTFAWFTDSASTAVNTIQSGTLKIDIASDAEGVNSLEGSTLNFVAKDGTTDVLWEPNATFNTEEFYIVNEGNLALKFQFAIVGAKGDLQLLDVIDFTAMYGDVDLLKADETALAANSFIGPIVISGHMDKDAGNEYQGLKVEGLAISIVAKQDTVEYDSNGNDYDKDAEYAVTVSTAAELANALAAGGNIILAEDITSADGLDIVLNKDTVLDLNGCSLTATGDRAILLNASGTADLTIKNGRIVAQSTNGKEDGSEISTGASTSVQFTSTGKLVMENVEIVGSSRGGHRAIQIGAGTAVLTNVDISSKYGSGVAAYGSAQVELNDCDIAVTGMYSQPYNSVCFAVMSGAEMTVNSGNYTMTNNNTYNTGDTHGGWIGTIMNSGGTLTVNGGEFVNIPAEGFNSNYERAIFYADQSGTAVTILNLYGGTFDPQDDTVYSTNGTVTVNGNIVDNNDGTWSASK